MLFCSNCGKEIESIAKFCSDCGSPNYATPANNEEQRRVVYDGKIRKCPNCGEILKAFEINCLSCGYEIRDVLVSSAVKEFEMKLESIESRREYEKPRGLFAAGEALQRVSKTDEQKISLIKSFSVPNSKEDMLEFMILATSSMNMSAYGFGSGTSISEKQINGAWFSKVQQVYEKAKRSYSTDNTFTEINDLYDSCIKKIRKAKKKSVINLILLASCLPLMFFMTFMIVNTSVPREETKALERLEKIVVEVQVALDNEEYKHALRIADSINYQGYSVEIQRKWDIQREYWIDKVLEEASKKGLNLEYTPTPD